MLLLYIRFSLLVICTSFRYSNNAGSDEESGSDLGIDGLEWLPQHRQVLQMLHYISLFG